MSETSLAEQAEFGLEPFADKESVRDFVARFNNWGRWGGDDQLGTLNLIDAEKRKTAAELVRLGRAVSLSRPLATTPAGNNPYPVQHFMEKHPRGDGAGAAHDFFSVACHGTANTHIDALSHVWDDDGLLYNGVPADQAIGFDGAAWGGLDQWRSGVFTRGVLVDIPGARGVPYVDDEHPVTAEELEAVIDAQGVSLRPGDALVVYCGRERWDLDRAAWSSEPTRPGLDVCCIKFLRRHDCAVLAWDMTDRKPTPHGLPWGVHVAIPAFGLALVDSVHLGELVETARELGRYDFLLTINPLVLASGTGSPVNPVAVF